MNKEKPNLIIIMGGVCSGKTEFRKNKYLGPDFNHIDAGEIFIELSENEYYEFPSHLEDKMNQIGLEKLRVCIFQKKDIVVEIVGENLEAVKELLELAKKIDYKTNVEFLECDVEDALQRNENRDENNISAYYCEPYHLDWFKKASTEYLNQSS